MFSKGLLQPLRVFASQHRRAGALYAYAVNDDAALRQVAALEAAPDRLAALDPGQLRTDPIPVGFTADQRLGFDLRVRPVRRPQWDCWHAAWRCAREGSGD